MATKKSATKPSAKQVDVYLRRIGKAAGSARVGEFVLIINPKTFGSTGDNWLGGRAFASRDAALAAAPKLGGRIAP